MALSHPVGSKGAVSLHKNPQYCTESQFHPPRYWLHLPKLLSHDRRSPRESYCLRYRNARQLSSVAEEITNVNCALFNICYVINMYYHHAACAVYHQIYSTVHICKMSAVCKDEQSYICVGASYDKVKLTRVLQPLLR